MKGNKGVLQIHLTLEARLLPLFHPLLQTGVRVETPTGISVRELLCGELGVPGDYLETAVQTVFLDGRAVDDLDSATVPDGSTLALSAAMPGLLGATLRRGSYYAAMRKEISHGGLPETAPSRRGTVIIKVFNLLLEVVGILLLKRGILVSGEYLDSLLERWGESFWSGCREFRLNDRKIEPTSLDQREWGGKEVFLRVQPLQ